MLGPCWLKVIGSVDMAWYYMPVSFFHSQPALSLWGAFCNTEMGDACWLCSEWTVDKVKFRARNPDKSSALLTHWVWMIKKTDYCLFYSSYTWLCVTRHMPQTDPSSCTELLYYRICRVFIQSWILKNTKSSWSEAASTPCKTGLLNFSNFKVLSDGPIVENGLAGDVISVEVCEADARASNRLDELVLLLLPLDKGKHKCAHLHFPFVQETLQNPVNNSENARIRATLKTTPNNGAKAFWEAPRLSLHSPVAQTFTRSEEDRNGLAWMDGWMDRSNWMQYF